MRACLAGRPKTGGRDSSEVNERTFGPVCSAAEKGSERANDTHAYSSYYDVHTRRTLYRSIGHGGGGGGDADPLLLTRGGERKGKAGGKKRIRLEARQKREQQRQKVSLIFLQSNDLMLP